MNDKEKIGGNKEKWKKNRRSNEEERRKNEKEKKGKGRMKEKYERRMFGGGRGHNLFVICLKKLTVLTVQRTLFWGFPQIWILVFKVMVFLLFSRLVILHNCPNSQGTLSNLKFLCWENYMSVMLFKGW